VNIYGKLAAVAFAIRAIPERLPRNTLNESSPYPLAADISPYSDNPGGVVAPLAVAAPEPIALILCAAQRSIAETNRRLSRRMLSVVTTIGEATNCNLSTTLHLHHPGMGALRHIIYSMDMVQALRSRHVVD
jgi:hypothetical protein